MNIVYLGIMSRPEDIGKFGEVSIAGNKFQYNLLNYLSKIDGIHLDIVSFHPFKSVQKSKKLFVRTTKEKIFDNVDLWQVGYVNLPIVKQLILPFQTYFRLKKLISRDTLVMAYDMYPTQGIPLSRIKKEVNGKTLCLLADLSIGGVVKQRGINKLLRKLFDISTLKNISKCDNYIVLNENVAKTYAPHANYIVMDGGIEPSEFEGETNAWDGVTKNILYTGALVDYSGIMNLVKAMELLDDKSIVLDIYGSGSLQSEIEQIAKNNPRIRFYGSVDNKTAMMAQQSAWLLANPRPVTSDIAKVTFPSKIFEYLMSGRPVMTTRLNGFSKDYDELLYWIDGETPEEIAKCIHHINNETPESHLKRAMAAKAYLLKNKTWESNAKKIYEFITKLNGASDGTSKKQGKVKT